MLNGFTKEINIKKYEHLLFSAKIIFVLFLSLALISQVNLAGAATTDQLQQRLDQKQQRLEQLERQIKESSRKAAQLAQQANTLQNHIQIFTNQIEQVTIQVEATQTKIEITNDQIESLNNEIEEQENHIEEVRTALGELLRQMYQMDRSNSTLMALMNNNSLSEFLNQVAQIESIQGQSYELLQEIKRVKAELEQNRAEMEKQKTELVDLQSSLEQQKATLNQQIRAKNNLLAITKGQESEYRRLLKESQEAEQQIQQEIRNLENEIRKQLGQRTTPGHDGIFVWPINGYITQRYGNTGFTSLGYNFHNGLDIAAPAGAPIYSVYDGKVVATGTGQTAYGNWITVKHTLSDGRSVITLYAHLTKILASTGQTVKQGQLIGTEGNTGNTTRLLYGPHRGFHLHFTVFDAEGFRIVPGAYQYKYGPYQVPVGYTYDPMDFL